MTSRFRFWVGLLVLLVSWSGDNTVRSEDPDSGWKAGCARALITPQEPMWMAGYAARDRPAEGTLDELWAKALVLEDDQQHQAVLVTLDLIGTDRPFLQAIHRRLAEQYGLSAEQIALCASHTHSGPALKNNLSPLHYLVVDAEHQAQIESYTAHLKDRIVELVGQALESREPVALSWGSGRAEFAVNRRNNRPEQDVPQLRAEGRLQGPTDHDVPVLAVHDVQGDLKAVVFGYACHATVLSGYEWSGDYPGFAQIELEQAHPGVQAMFWAGCGADQNPLPRRSVQLARDYGRQLAEAVQAVLHQPMEPLPPRLVTQYREVDLPFAELPSREQIETDRQSSNRFVAARAQMLQEQWDQQDGLADTYPYPVQTWQLGETIQFVILGGEVVVDFALRLKSELRGTQTWVAGFANDVMAYIASRRVLDEGGYEGAGAMLYYGLPTSWAPESEDLIVDEVHRQLAP